MTAAPIVETRELSRTYGEGETAVHALRSVSVAFPAGGFAAIMGPSGSGKSTLMHLLAGLDSPTSGSVVIDAQELAGLDDKGLTRLRRDRLGFVFQALNLVFAALVSRPLADQGFTFTLPVPTLAVLLVLAALAGVVAAIPPARRAARVDALRAVTTE